MTHIKVKSITISQFKGIDKKTYNFDGYNSKISAENGAGKSTIADAFYWVFADRDSQLVSNPNIRPNNIEEALPRVDIELDVEGTQILVAKQQKKTKSKPDSEGTVKVSLTNSYEINSVPKSEKDFKSYFADRDIDLSLFLELSHPDVFTFGLNDKKQREHMRSVLFGMCGKYTDYDIASNIPGLDRLTNLLSDYSLEEIEAMETSTMKKANEQLEQIPMRIVGMEETKVKEDKTELKKSKDAISKELESIRSHTSKANANEERLTKISNELTKLRSGLMSYKSDLSAKANEERFALSRMIDEKNNSLSRIKSAIDDNEKMLLTEKNRLNREKKALTDARERYARENSKTFNETELVCPTCGRAYDDESSEKIRTDFENRKSEILASIVEAGNQAKHNVAEIEMRIASIEADTEEKQKETETIPIELAKMQKDLSIMPTGIDFSKDEKVISMTAQIEKLSNELLSISSADDSNVIASERERELQRELIAVEKKLSLVEHNKDIDLQIESLRKQQIEYENVKTKCEQLLKDQIPSLRKHKNDLLSSEINSHFTLVKFKLFDFQKNGNYIDVCEPMIDGKSFSSESNSALKVLAKLDIIGGLQNFYEVSFPVFVDGFESVTENTRKRIEKTYQLITLSAVDGIKDVIIENE